MSKAMRNGLRVGDLSNMKYFEQRLTSLVKQLQISYPELEIDINEELAYYNSIRDEVMALTCDTIYYTNQALSEGRKVLIEGANATMIDLDFGTYPYVTSSNPSVGSVCTGLGVPPTAVGSITGIVKAYCTRVGEGPFPTELSGDLDDTLRSKGGEFGTTTGRPRRCGWIDIPQLRFSAMVNGFTELNLTKLDVLSGFKELRIGSEYLVAGEAVRGMPADLETYSAVAVRYETMPGWDEDISGCRHFSELPVACQNYVRRVEQLVGVPIRWVGVGAGREALLEKAPDA